jgi:hypothetical protein
MPGQYLKFGFHHFLPLTTYLNPWGRIILAKVHCSTIQKISCLLCNPKIHYGVLNSPLLDPILSKLNGYPVTMAWHVFTLQMQETAYRYGS